MAMESGQVVQFGHKTQSRTASSWFGGNSDVEEFLENLRAKYGTVTRAWRVGLDSDESGALDFGEFCRAVRSLGMTGNLRTLFFNLDTDTSGVISLSELDAHASRVLEKFRARGTERFGTIQNMWNVFDQDKSGTVAFAEFCESVGELGYTDPEETKELFNLLILRVGCRYITLNDILFLQNWDEMKRAMIWKKRVGVGWINRDPSMTRDANPAVSGMLPGLVDNSSQDFADMVSLDLDKTKEDFQNFLITRYGSLPKAFEHMDANDSGCLSLTEFISVVSSGLEYCRPADARRLFMLMIGDGSATSQLTWEKLGITQIDWVHHVIEKRAKQKWLEEEARANAKAKLGRSPRIQRSLSRHTGRMRHAKTREDIVFFTPLPKGYEDLVPTGLSEQRRKSWLPQTDSHTDSRSTLAATWSSGLTSAASGSFSAR
jgi:Ca2+-binding EF-hand superfamily protein